MALTGDDHLRLGVEAKAEEAARVLGDGLAERHRAEAVRVLVVATAERRDRRLADHLGAVEVGKPDPGSPLQRERPAR